MNSKKNWHTHILTYLWIAIGVSSSVTLINMFFSSLDTKTFFLERFLLPFVLEVLILFILEWQIRSHAPAIRYYIVIGTQAIVTILFVVHSSIFL